MQKLKRIEEKGRFGYIDRNGKVIIQPRYSYAPKEFGTASQQYATVSEGNKYGVIDCNGVTIIPFEFDDVFFLFDNLFSVRKNTRKNDWYFAVIDTNNKVIIQYKYKAILAIGKCIECYREASCHKSSSSSKLFDYTPNFSLPDLYNSDGTLIYHGRVKDNVLNRVLVIENFKYGVIDTSGKRLIDCLYEDINCIDNDCFIACIEENSQKKYGVIDEKGTSIINFDYESISHKNGFFYCIQKCEIIESQRSAYSTLCEKKRELWFNRRGDKVHEGKAEILNKHLLAISIGQYWGVANSLSQKIVNIEYDMIGNIGDNIVVVKNEKIGIIAFDGKVIISPNYKRIECVNITNKRYRSPFRFHEEYLQGQYNLQCVFDTSEEDSKLYHKEIKLVTDIYKKLFIAPEDFIFNSYFILTDDNNSELFTTAEGTIPNSQFDSIEILNNNFFAVRKGELWGVWEVKSRSFVFPCIYNKLRYEGGDTILLFKDGFWGADTLSPASSFHQKSNSFFETLRRYAIQTSIPHKYLEIKQLTKDVRIFGVLSNYNRYDIIDRQGKPYMNMDNFRISFEEQFSYFSPDRILTKSNGLYGFISVYGVVTIPFIYDEIEIRADGYFDVRIGPAWGVISISGTTIVEIKYCDRIAKSWSNTIVKSVFSGCMGILSESGDEIIPSIYDFIIVQGEYIFCNNGGYIDIDYYGNNFSGQIRDGKWGCMRTDGTVVFHPKYDYILIEEPYILASRNGVCFVDEHENEYMGVYDLFNKDGDLIIGGFSCYRKLQSGQMALFFGGTWKRIVQAQSDLELPDIVYYQFSRQNGKWLLLNSNLTTINRNEDGKRYQMPKGFRVHTDIIEQKNRDYLFSYNIYDSDLNSFMLEGDLELQSSNLILKEEIYVEGEFFDYGEVIGINLDTGEKSLKYQGIEYVNESTFVFKQNSKYGIANYQSVILSADFYCITKPVNNYCFAFKDLDPDYTSVVLISIGMVFEPISAIKRCLTKEIINHILAKSFLIFFNNEKANELHSIQVAEPSIFDKTFRNLISRHKKGVRGSSFEAYWFSDAYDLEPYVSDHDIEPGFYDRQVDSILDAFEGDPDNYWNVY